MSSYFEPDDPRVLLAGSIYTSGTVSVPVKFPTNSEVGINDGAINVYGAWVTVVAAAVLTSHMLIGYLAHGTNNVARYDFDIGTGAAGSEVVIATFPHMLTSNVAGASNPAVFLPIPLKIPANARVAVRGKDDVGGLLPQGISLIFIPRPLA